MAIWKSAPPWPFGRSRSDLCELWFGIGPSEDLIFRWKRDVVHWVRLGWKLESVRHVTTVINARLSSLSVKINHSYADKLSLGWNDTRKIMQFIFRWYAECELRKIKRTLGKEPHYRLCCEGLLLQSQEQLVYLPHTISKMLQDYFNTARYFNDRSSNWSTVPCEASRLVAVADDWPAKGGARSRWLTAHPDTDSPDMPMAIIMSTSDSKALQWTRLSPRKQTAGNKNPAHINAVGAPWKVAAQYQTVELSRIKFLYYTDSLRLGPGNHEQNNWSPTDFESFLQD